MLLPLLSPAQTAHLESDRIFEGDIALLVIEHESRFASLYALDTSELEKRFEILDVKAGTSRMMTSDQERHRMQWRLQILPRETGRIKVPPVSLAGGLTPELILEVLPLSAQARANRMVKVEAEVSPANPYVGQQTNVTLRLVYNTPVSDGSWWPPKFANARLIHDLNDARFSEIRDGARFSVLERRMALFPKLPGAATGSPARYRARIRAPSNDIADSDPETDFRWVFRQSAPLQVRVRDIPAGFTGSAWIPAQHLEITQHWGDYDDLRVGDTLDRGLIITARGLPSDALPAGLFDGDAEAFKVYADRETRTHRFEQRVLVGRLEQPFTIVLTTAGQITIPEVRLKWWDTDQDVEKEAVAPGKVVNVNPAVATQDRTGAAPSARPARNTTSIEISLRNSLTWLLAAIVIIGVLLLAYHRNFGHGAGANLQSILRRHKARRLLKQACLANDPANARTRLIAWARQQWPETPINGLYQIVDKVPSAGLRDEFSKLDGTLFSPHQTKWQGDRLWRSIASTR